MSDCKVYEYLVVGAGSGGLASARRAARHLNARSPKAPNDGQAVPQVAIVEHGAIGGTCVNVGCVPKKLMYLTSRLAEALNLLGWHGFQEAGLKSVSDDWDFLRDRLETELQSSNLIKELKSKKFSLVDQQPTSDPAVATPPQRAAPKKHKMHRLSDVQKDFLAQQSQDKIAIGFDWNAHKRNRDGYVRRLHGSYRAALLRDRIDLLTSTRPAAFSGDFVDVPGCSEPRPVLLVNDERVTAKHILLATGGTPILPADTQGAVEYGITSDEFFSLEHQPKRVAIIGSGYISVELAGVFAALGSHVTVFARGDRVLRHHFDPDVSLLLHEDMIKQGIAIRRDCHVTSISKTKDHIFRLIVSDCRPVDDNTFQDVPLDTSDQTHGHSTLHLDFDLVMFAVGRKPNTAALNLSAVGIAVDDQGYVVTDEAGQTSLGGVYALGDVTRQFPHLTPVAIMAGRRLAENLFGAVSRTASASPLALLPCHGRLVPTVVFSHPPLGVIGLTEPEVRAQYPADRIRIHQTRFTSMMYGLVLPGHPDRHLTFFKVITVLEATEAGAEDAPLEEYVKGVHMLGEGVDEFLQGVALAMTAAYNMNGGKGLRMSDFRDTIPIHPTSSEELVTID